jgi:hypothetical protein
MRTLLSLALLGVLLAGCDAADPVGPDPEPLEVVLVENLPADPPTGRDPQTGQPVGTTDRFTLYSLRENRIVLSSTEPNRADSASTAWDIGFRATTIIFNSGTSGPGDAAAQILQLPFDEVSEAPAGGYRQDQGSDLAIPTGAGNGWYSYIPTPPVGGYISPTPGRTIVVRTADGRYAKLRILSYYEDQPEEPINIFEERDRFYTFEYVFQEDGSRTFGSD